MTALLDHDHRPHLVGYWDPQPLGEPASPFGYQVTHGTRCRCGTAMVKVDRHDATRLDEDGEPVGPVIASTGWVVVADDWRTPADAQTQDTEGVSTPGWTREPNWTDDVTVPGDWD